MRVLLETAAGQGSCVGHRFEHLRDILGAVRQRRRVAVCFDTCHVHAAGYDLTSEEGYAETIAAFDRTVGLSKLAAIHVNDSKKPRGSRVDRHEHIGKGEIGRRGFRNLMTDPRLASIPSSSKLPRTKPSPSTGGTSQRSAVSRERHEDPLGRSTTLPLSRRRGDPDGSRHHAAPSPRPISSTPRPLLSITARPPPRSRNTASSWKPLPSFRRAPPWPRSARRETPPARPSSTAKPFALLPGRKVLAAAIWDTPTHSEDQADFLIIVGPKPATSPGSLVLETPAGSVWRRSGR